MQAYVAYHKEGKHAARYGIANFRVITVTSTKQRALNLCTKLKEVGLASKRFRFTDLSAISAEQPAGILEKIFLTPKGWEAGVRYAFEIKARRTIQMAAKAERKVILGLGTSLDGCSRSSRNCRSGNRARNRPR